MSEVHPTAPDATPVARGALDLGAILLETTTLSETQLAEAQQRRAETGQRLTDLLVAAGWVSADQVMEALSRQLDLPVRPNIRADVVDETLIERIPISFCKNHVLLPLQRDMDGGVRVAVADPHDLGPLDDLRLLFAGAEIRLELANQRTILGAINEVYDRGADSTDALAEDAAEDLDHLADEISHEPQDLLEAADDAPIIKLVNSLLQHAVKDRASDVHLEPFENEVRVRFRDRRHSLRADETAAAVHSGEHRVAHQDHGRTQHRREAPAAGRPHPPQDCRARLRRAPLDGADRARRARGDAAPPAHPGDARPREDRLQRESARPDCAAHRATERHRAGDRTHRQRQDHDALRGTLAHQLHRQEHHHRSRTRSKSSSPA